MPGNCFFENQQNSALQQSFALFGRVFCGSNSSTCCMSAQRGAPIWDSVDVVASPLSELLRTGQPVSTAESVFEKGERGTCFWVLRLPRVRASAHEPSLAEFLSATWRFHHGTHPSTFTLCVPGVWRVRV